MDISRLFSLAFVAGLILPAGSVSADSLSGNWSGSGYVQPTNGKRENVRCKVTYTPQGAKVVAVAATCASASVTIRQTGSLSLVNSNRYVGEFYNPDYDISGRVRVNVSGGSQTVTFSSARGGGSMSLRRR